MGEQCESTGMSCGLEHVRDESLFKGTGKFAHMQDPENAVQALSMLGTKACSKGQVNLLTCKIKGTGKFAHMQDPENVVQQACPECCFCVLSKRRKIALKC